LSRFSFFLLVFIELPDKFIQNVKNTDFVKVKMSTTTFINIISIIDEE
jgi:hypothetical protein